MQQALDLSQDLARVNTGLEGQPPPPAILGQQPSRQAGLFKPEEVGIGLDVL